MTRSQDLVWNGIRREKLRLKCGSFYIAKDRASKPQGDDSHFIYGVGGWSKHGVDAGLYAAELINNSLLATLTQPLTQVDPMKVLDEAFSKTKAQGSSTACIITLQEGNMLHAVKVGDSRFMVIRRVEIIYKSPIQLHSFNFPYQLGNSANCAKPRQAQVIKVRVAAGDVIIAGTDGLFDNLFELQILATASKGIEQDLGAEEMVWEMAQLAYQPSRDKAAVTPFMEASKRAGRFRDGGKGDDITVIVSRILGA
ncbi:hypothetical protein ES319_D08G134000v1 [Gossypium barbadense]|uniref:Protein phosphatase n=1 Tax=Gossypium barbadense TaxID=3634 RepID=A0A5J5QEB7_GOSBA|nr:hypothetical protein ES319_D08G134000v1 [Gossypium barbadense]